MSLRNIIRQVITEIDWFYVIVVMIISVLLITIGMFGLLGSDNSKEKMF